jgi:aspartyl-tRNA synthetase
LDAVREEVRCWDTSALAAQFGVAQRVLLGENNLAIDRLEQMVERGDLEFETIVDWPLFEFLRDDARWRELVARQAGKAAG